MLHIPVLKKCSCLLPLALVLLGSPVHAAQPESLRLVPFPKMVALRDGSFALDGPLLLKVSKDSPSAAAEAIASEFRLNGLTAPKLEPLADAVNELRLVPADKAADGGAVDLPFRENAGDEDYGLQVSPDAITIRGHGASGTLYGGYTLCQLLRANRAGNGIGCMTIRDWPSLRWRSMQDDLTRGPSSTLNELEREASLAASLKLNLFTYYMEHQFAFARHPVIGPKDGSLLPSDLSALVEHVRPLQMNVLGNQQSFGHFANILVHEEFAALRETGGILCPVNEATYRLLDDMYSEEIPRLPFGFFNVCCDETQGLGTGPSKDLAAQVGVGGVYTRHIRRVHELVKGKYGKRMMMWGDIILTHPDHLAEIPKDVVMLTWAYDPRADFESQIIPFAKSGYEFFVCPGVNGWGRILPDFEMAAVNIRNFVRDGVKHGALGMINTAWDDDGETLNAPNWHGNAWGAECAWSGAQTSIESFNGRIGAVLFGEPGDHFGQAIALLSPAFKLPGMHAMHNAKFWGAQFTWSPDSVAGAKVEAEKLLALVTPAIEHLQACRKEAKVNGELLDAFIFGAQRMELIGQRTLNELVAAQAYQAACEHPGDSAGTKVAEAEQLIRVDAEQHRAIADRYVQLWNRENRPYALDVPMSRYAGLLAGYDALVKKLVEAGRDLAAGKPLPGPAEMGLGIFDPAKPASRPG